MHIVMDMGLALIAVLMFFGSLKNVLAALDKRNDGRLKTYQDEIVKYTKANNELESKNQELKFKLQFFESVGVVIMGNGYYALQIGDTRIVIRIRINDVDSFPEEKEKKV